MEGSIFREEDTAPIVNGGSYIFKLATEGTTVEGLMLGVLRTEGIRGKPDRVEGNLYIFTRGPIPVHVVENTESFKGWELVTAPAKSAAGHINGMHKTKSRKPVTA